MKPIEYNKKVYSWTNTKILNADNETIYLYRNSDNPLDQIIVDSNTNKVIFEGTIDQVKEKYINSTKIKDIKQNIRNNKIKSVNSKKAKEENRFQGININKSALLERSYFLLKEENKQLKVEIKLLKQIVEDLRKQIVEDLRGNN